MGMSYPVIGILQKKITLIAVSLHVSDVAILSTTMSLVGKNILPACGFRLPVAGGGPLSTPGFLSPDAYYAIPHNPRTIVFARHDRLISQNIIHYNS
jgi:hypothetical protein